MEDLLTAHAERVAAANAELLQNVERARDEADARMREKIAAFGGRLVDIAREADELRAALAANFAEIAEGIRKSTQDDLDANVAEVALSAAAMHGEIADRTSFMATGVLPSSSPRLPPMTELRCDDADAAA